MTAKPGNVLVIAERENAAERLGRWIAAAGERPVLVHGPDIQIFERGGDSTIDLVVTDLDPGAPDARPILETLLRGELFAGVPRLHLLPPGASSEGWPGAQSEPATVALPAPADSTEFRTYLRLVTEIGRLRRELAASALRDRLTGAYNRQHIITRLREEFSRSRRYETPLSFVLLELDQLVEIRERYGFEAGESALLQLHHTLRAEVREENIHGRWSDGTLAAILPGSPYRGAAVFANKVRGDAASTELSVGEDPVRLRVSAGISAVEADRGNGAAETLIQAAEAALAEARRRGGNRVHIDRKLMGGGRRWILLADVDVALLDPAEDLLTMDGYRVVRAESPNAVLAAVRKRLPDLLLIDLQMAGTDADGLSLVEQVRALCHEHPLCVVGLAGPDFSSQRLTGSRLRVDRYLTKPFSVSVLRSIAHDLLEHSDLA